MTATTTAAGLSLLALAGLSFSLQDGEGHAPLELDPSTPRYSKSGYDITPLSKEEIAAIVETLDPLQVRVTQQAGTERPGTGFCLNEKRPGVYVSVVGGLPLFKAEHKFDSGTGWPSYFAPFDPEHIIERPDDTLGMRRVELLDARSGAHLGHVFNDGPKPTGLRYCINAASLRFIPQGQPLPPESRPVDAQKAYFAGGCFWGVEDLFSQIEGVMDSVSGYQGGTKDAPTYRQVCAGKTGHAEAVEVTFDPARVSYEELLTVFFANHDPTTRDRQGPDVGSQYRSAVFATSPEQERAARKAIDALSRTAPFQGRAIVTQVVHPAPRFWPAEEEHQDYNARHGRSCKVVR